MAVIGWGKPKIIVKDLDTDGAQWRLLPTPVEDSTQLETTKGDKTEAKIEGGENEDVKYSANTYALNFNIRIAKNRKKPFADVDGNIAHNYAVCLQPEDPDVPGFYMEKAAISFEDSFSTAEGGVWAYTADALKKDQSTPQVKWGVVEFSESGGKITGFQFTEVTAETEPTT